MNKRYNKATTKIETQFGEFDFACYSWSDHEEDNILCASSKLVSTENVLTRVQSACYTAEIFRSLDCDCHEQLEESLRMIQAEGGILIYMLCDGRGAGLLNKVRGLELGRTMNLDTSDAYKHLKIPQDPRTYERVSVILNDLNISSIRLLTNNPRKVEGISLGGITVTMQPLEIPATKNSQSYLLTKTRKMGHLMKQFGQKNT
jgi:GTP cyclohydrolase II